MRAAQMGRKQVANGPNAAICR